MLSPHIQAALAHERHQTFLAEAETDRRAKQARLHRRQADTHGARRWRRWHPARLRPGRRRLLGLRPRSAVTGRPVVLRNGSTVLIRQVQSADAPLVADGFARLSARPGQLRFLMPKELSPAELRYCRSGRSEPWMLRGRLFADWLQRYARWPRRMAARCHRLPRTAPWP